MLYKIIRIVAAEETPARLTDQCFGDPAKHHFCRPIDGHDVAVGVGQNKSLASAFTEGLKGGRDSFNSGFSTCTWPGSTRKSGRHVLFS